MCFPSSFIERKPGDRDQDIQKKKAALDQKLDELSRQRAMHRCEKREVIYKMIVFLILFVFLYLKLYPKTKELFL